ncbi:hypothetical protein C1N87_28450 (plasmid) [Priestia aryabhattai]
MDTFSILEFNKCVRNKKIIMFGGNRDMKNNKSGNENSNKVMLTLKDKNQIAVILNKRLAENNKDIQKLETEFTNKINQLKYL